MKNKGKLIVGPTEIELPTTFVEKYKEEYFIEEREGKHLLNISSKYYVTMNPNGILRDLKEVVKDAGFTVYAAVLWTDGDFLRINLTTGRAERFASNDEYYL